MEIDGLYDGEWNEGVPVPQNRLHLDPDVPVQQSL